MLEASKQARPGVFWSRTYIRRISRALHLHRNVVERTPSIECYGLFRALRDKLGLLVKG